MPHSEGSEESVVLAIVQGNPRPPAVAKQMRRLFGPCSGAARQDVLATADLAASPVGVIDPGAWVSRREATISGRRSGRLDFLDHVVARLVKTYWSRLLWPRPRRGK